MTYSLRILRPPRRPFCVEVIFTENGKMRGFAVVIPVDRESIGNSFEREIYAACEELLRGNDPSLDVGDRQIDLFEVPYHTLRAVADRLGFTEWPA